MMRVDFDLPDGSSDGVVALYGDDWRVIVTAPHVIQTPIRDDWEQRCSCGEGPARLHEATHHGSGEKSVCLDTGIIPLVTALWGAGLETKFSCESQGNDTFSELRLMSAVVGLPSPAAATAALDLLHSAAPDESARSSAMVMLKRMGSRGNYSTAGVLAVPSAMLPLWSRWLS